MLCCAMLCYAMLRYATLCYATLCYAMLCYLAELFDFGDKVAAAKATVTEMRNSLVLVKSLWDLVCIVQSQVDEWKEVLWDEIDPEKMEEETKVFSKMVRLLDKSVRGWQAYT